MLNVIKADLYRILRGKAVYITFVILIGFIALQIGVEDVGRVGVNTGSTIDGNFGSQLFNGMSAASIMLMTMDNLLYFLLPLIIAVGASMFTHGTVKNTLATGMPRVKLYLSKLILSSVFCIILMIFYILAAVLFGTIIRGFGGPLTGEWLLSVLRPFGAQMFLMLAFNCIGIFLVFVTKRTAVVNSAYIAISVIPLLIIQALSIISEKFLVLYNYDLVCNIRLLSNINAMSGSDIAQAIVIGALYIVVSTAAGITIFQKSEIK